MERPTRKPAMEAARRILTLVTLDGSEEGRRFMAFALSRANEDEYVRQVKEMVEAELPFWELLRDMPLSNDDVRKRE